MFFKNFFNHYKRPLLIGLLFFAVMEYTVFVTLSYLKEKDINSNLNIFTSNLEEHINIAHTHFSTVSQMFYESKVANEAVINIMDKAMQTQDSKKLASLRKKLYLLLNKDYVNMRRNGIWQLQFHLPNAVSFLRFHRTDRYGDSLIGIRQTLEYVNKHHIPISAFEEGRVCSGFRNVYPIFKDKKFVGTVELSLFFNAVQEFLTKTDHSSYSFIIQKQLVEKTIFKDEKKNYKQSEFKNYYYNRKTLDDTIQMRRDKMFAINRAIT